MDKQSLLAKIKQLDNLTDEERSELVELLNTKKKYGLIWEDKPEDVEEQLRTQLPILREVVEKRILATKSDSEAATPKTIKTNLFTEEENQINHSSDDVAAPNHILIEGDNLHALTALTFTHEGTIDVMYFDPPYNTGNKDFKYNDSFVDKEDSYRHSKWLSFMHKRLEIAKRLLSDKGVIFISIDDNEQAQIKLLCDDVFVDKNFIGLLPTIMNLKGNQDQFCFAGTHEYTLVYCKEKSMFTPNSFSFDLEELEEWEEDEIGLYKKGAPLRATGAESNREDRPLMFYPILIDKNNNVSTITEEEHSFIYDKTTKTFDDNHLSDLISNYLEIDLEVILPKVDSNQHGRWRWGFNKNTIKRLEYDVIVSRTKNGISLYKKQRPELGDLPSKKPKSIFYKPEYSSGNGTSQLKDIFDNKIFNNPKPLELIKDFITIGSNKTSIILDFFAGSGTTLHATMQLNAEDGGNRQCILVTNNENNICEEVTYERNKRVIQGYTNAKGVQVEGLTNNNFRYYRSEYVGRDHTHKNKKELVLAATELLCIKEDIYTELTELNGQKLNNKVVRCFSDKGKYMLVIYDEEAIETLLPLISTINSHKKIKIYIFAPGQYPFTEEFEDVLDKVELCALPDAIYKAYANVLPKKKAKPAVYSNEESTESETNEIVEPNLFTV
jgi:adenine-specific DNA-methyltransferase